MDRGEMGVTAGTKRKATTGAAAVDDGDLLLEEEEEEGVNPVEVLEGSKHGDGSLYKYSADVYRWLYQLADTRETSIEPMRLSAPTPECTPTFTACRRHVGTPMLQIFSVKVARLPRPAAAGGCGGPIHLYGFMAVRDLMDPLRNYVFRRTRDEPLVIRDLGSDPFVHLSGPKRGVRMHPRVLFEYDLRIIRHGEDDLPLIDGVAVFSEKPPGVDAPAAFRIRGERGAAVDVSRALFPRAVEATVEAWVTELGPGHRNRDGGLDLAVSAYAPGITEEMKLFRGAVAEPRALGRFVVAVSFNSYLILYVRALPGGLGKFAFRGMAHASITDCQTFDFATIEVKVTWSANY